MKVFGTDDTKLKLLSFWWKQFCLFDDCRKVLTNSFTSVSISMLALQQWLKGVFEWFFTMVQPTNIYRFRLAFDMNHTCLARLTASAWSLSLRWGSSWKAGAISTTWKTNKTLKHDTATEKKNLCLLQIKHWLILIVCLVMNIFFYSKISVLDICWIKSAFKPTRCSTSSLDLLRVQFLVARAEKH